MSSPQADSAARPKRFPKPGLNTATFGTLLFLLIALPCILSVPWTVSAPSGQETGKRYNDLRYDDKAVVDGQEVEVLTQEQGPGVVDYVVK